MILVLWVSDYEKFGEIKRSIYELMRQFQAPEMVGIVTVDKMKIKLEYPNYTNLVWILLSSYENKCFVNSEQEQQYFKLHKFIEYFDFDKFKIALRHLEL